MDCEIVADGLAFPEGPVVMPDGSVIFVEIAAGCLSRAWNGRTERIAQLGGGPAGAALGPDGAVYVANLGGVDFERLEARSGPGQEGRIERVDLATGQMERLYDSCEGQPLSAPDDLVFDAEGGFWFSDLGKHFHGHQEHGGIYYAKADGSAITRWWYPAMTMNGIGLAPDGRTVFAASTATARVWALPLAAPGELMPAMPGGSHPARGRTDLLATIPGDCAVDSFAVTQTGTICVATLHRGGITSIRPDGVQDFLALPNPYTTNIAFGGADMRWAYITQSSSGTIIRMRWDEPGLKLNYGLY